MAPEAQRIEQAQLTRTLQQLLKKEGFRSRGTLWFLDKGRGDFQIWCEGAGLCKRGGVALGRLLLKTAPQLSI